MKIINRKLLCERTGRCEWCGGGGGITDWHHVIRRGLGGGSRIDHRFNLMEVHRWVCHEWADRAQKQCFDIIGQREGIAPATLKKVLQATLRAPKEAAHFVIDDECLCGHKGVPGQQTRLWYTLELDLVRCPLCKFLCSLDPLLNVCKTEPPFTPGVE